MARLILTSPMARLATLELVQRLEVSLRLFPELGDEPVTFGLTASRWLDGLAIPEERFIRLNLFRRRMVTYFTIGHELTHLLQPPGLPLIPSGEVLRVWPAGPVDAALEVLKVRLRDGEGEGGNGVITLCFDRLRKR